MPGYMSSFVFGSPATAIAFDVLAHGYGRETKANATVRAVPWASSSYGVVIQWGGNQPERLTLTSVWYAEADYQAAIAALTGLGTLVTPRYPGGVKAWLESVRTTDTDLTTPDGWVKGQIVFVLLGQPGGVVTGAGNPVVTGAGAVVEA